MKSRLVILSVALTVACGGGVPKNSGRPTAVPTLEPVVMAEGLKVDYPPNIQPNCSGTDPKKSVALDLEQIVWEKTEPQDFAIKLKGGYTLHDKDVLDVRLCGHTWVKLGEVSITWDTKAKYPSKVLLYPYAEPIFHKAGQ